jgi:predicted transcriptional regulator
VPVLRTLLGAHFRILKRLEKAGEDGVVASELIPSREARELVLGMLSSDGLIKRRKKFRGERVFITKRGLILLKSMGEEIVS